MVLAVALVLIGPRGALGQGPQGYVLSIEELRGLAAERPVRPDSLLLAYDIFQDPAAFSPDSHIAHMSRNVLVDAATGRYSMDEVSQVEHTEHDLVPQTVEFTFDGEVQAAFLPDQMMGVLREGADADGLQMSALWGVMMLGEPQPGGLGSDDASLVSLLNRGTVRDQLEFVGETPCHVVDAFYEGVRYATVWLDVERGLLPMKRVGYGRDGNVSSAVTVDSVVFLEAEQVWLPESWQTEFQAMGETLRSYTVVVPESVKINPPVSDEHFRRWFPPGTIVSDLISGQAYRIADSGEIGEILYERRGDEWFAVSPSAATERGGRAESPPRALQPAELRALGALAPIFSGLAELMELAARQQPTQQAQGAESPVTGESRPVAGPEPAPEEEESAAVVPDLPRAQEPEQRPESDVAQAARAQPSKSPWRWIVGLVAVLALLLGIGYSVRRHNRA
jgi:hypothetical protein